MKSIRDLLRDADPLGYELPRSQTDRIRRRQAILDTRTSAAPIESRRNALVAIAAVAVAAAVTGTRYWSRATDLIAAVRFEVHLAETSPGAGLQEAEISGTDRKIYLHEETVVSNADIAEAHIVAGNSPDAIGVALTFTPGGSAKMAGATQSHIGRPMAVLIDGRVVMAPTVRSVMSTNAVITGTFSKAEADRIVTGIIGR